ncbi:cadherin-related family member 5 isoform 5-T8 [Spinachia spinachia]
MLRPCSLLLWQVAVSLSSHVVTASRCGGGSDIFTALRENSPMGQFISELGMTAEAGANKAERATSLRLCVSGDDAAWFYLEGRTLRLNASDPRVLDREAHGPMLIAELTCYQDNVIQTKFRILVEILNENDNRPKFVKETIHRFTVSELTAVNSVLFTVKAMDADGDMISYIIDPSSEVNTEEKFNISAVLTVNIEDGDDQYPHFLPCTPISPGDPVCVSPNYSTNISQKQQDLVLKFSPGPIRAEDGDRGLNTSLIYSILSGGDQSQFRINNRTGEIQLTRAVPLRHQEKTFTLTVMVCQEDDRLKYSVVSVLIRVLNENTFPPVFNRTTFKGFIVENLSPASIVTTYGNQVLQIKASDRDFSDGLNPNIHYSILPPSGLYQVTDGGVLIARTDRLHAFDRHKVRVVARDAESGEEVSALVDIEVLQTGQSVPHGAVAEQQMFGNVDIRLAGGIIAMILLLLLSAVVFLMLRAVKRR